MSKYVQSYECDAFDGPPGPYSYDCHHLSWTDPQDTTWPYLSLAHSHQAYHLQNGFFSKLPLEICVHVMLYIPNALSKQDMTNLSLTNTFFANLARICRFYYLHWRIRDKILRESRAQQPFTFRKGRILSWNECVHHLDLTFDFYHEFVVESYAEAGSTEPWPRNRETRVFRQSLVDSRALLTLFPNLRQCTWNHGQILTFPLAINGETVASFPQLHDVGSIYRAIQTTVIQPTWLSISARCEELDLLSNILISCCETLQYLSLDCRERISSVAGHLRISLPTDVEYPNLRSLRLTDTVILLPSATADKLIHRIESFEGCLSQLRGWIMSKNVSITRLRTQLNVDVDAPTLCAIAQFNIKLTHLDVMGHHVEMASFQQLLETSALDRLQSLRVGISGRDYQSSLPRLLEVLSSLQYLESCSVCWSTTGDYRAYKRWRLPHEHVAKALRATKMRRLSITGVPAACYLTPLLRRLRIEHNKLDPTSSRECKPTPEALLRAHLHSLARLYATELPHLRALCITDIKMSISCNDERDSEVRIVNDTEKWRFLRGKPKDEVMDSRQYRKDRKQRI